MLKVTDDPNQLKYEMFNTLSVDNKILYSQIYSCFDIWVREGKLKAWLPNDDLEYCDTLICKDCVDLQYLPDRLSNCMHLDCTNCPNVDYLPYLPKCKYLTCDRHHILNSPKSIDPNHIERLAIK